MIKEIGLGPIIANSFGDHYYHSVNGSAFSRVGSAALYQQHFGDSLLEENSLYVVLGTDSGLLPKYIQNAGLPGGSRYVFVELPEILSQINPLLPEGGLDSRIILTTPDQWKERAVEIEYQNYVYLGRMNFFRSIGAEDLHIEDYQYYGRFLQEELEKVHWILNAQIGNALFNLRQLENLPENCFSVKYLEDTFNGKSAVILGGGPSLDQSLAWVAVHREDLLVIAVSRICRRLLEVNLVPDIVVSIDPNDIGFDISKEMLLFGEKTIFVPQHHVSSKLLGQWNGRSFFIGKRFGWPTPWNDDCLSERGPTVTNTAIELAVQMGVSRIFLSGVDLCFSSEGFTHAQGSNEHKAGRQLAQGQLWVETNAGNMAETTPDFHSAITIISDQARLAGGKNCQLYSLSPDAARIDGVDFIQPETVLLGPLPRPAFELLQSAIPEENSLIRSKYLQGILSEMDRAITIFKEIKAHAEDGIKANDGFFGRRGKVKGSPKYKNKLDRIEKKLKNEYPDFSLLLKKVGVKDFLKMTHGEQDHQQWSEADVERLGRVYYESYRDSAKRLQKMVESARKRVLSRLEEEKETPDYNCLIRQWEEDRQPGRVLVWKRRNPDKEVPPEVEAEFKRLEADFEKILTETETIHMTRAKALAELGAVCGKLKLMYRRAERENLQRLVDCLGVMEQQEAKVLYQLGCGYCAELDLNKEVALGHYQLVLDLMIGEQEGAGLEEALLRVFALSLEKQDTENALMAADCLAGLSATYLPYYADMLKIAGNKAGALDIYADYLERCHGDLAVMLKMGRMYHELGVGEGARLMFNTVLERDPLNQAAKQLLAELDAGEAE